MSEIREHIEFEARHRRREILLWIGTAVYTLAAVLLFWAALVIL